MRLSLIVMALALGVGCGAPPAAGEMDVATDASHAMRPRAPRPYPIAMCSNGRILSERAYIEKMIDSGARMCRTDVTFPSVRKGPGADPDAWNWSQLERVRALRAEYPKMEWLGLLGYGAAWAADERFEPRSIASPQRGIDVMPAESPANLYGHYVYETVRRYRDVVTYWESWNEPDLSGHHYFAGSGADFAPYQKACYLAAKKADPDCTVVFAAMCYPTFEGYLATHGLKPPTPYPPSSSFFEEYLRAVAKDPHARAHNYYFDVMNQHTYSRATDAYDYIAVVRKLMGDHIGQSDKPVWITEMGMTDKGGTFGGTPDEYCDYVLQSYAWGALADVERFFHFQLDNSNGHGLYNGMLGDPKPVLTTYRDVLSAELAGARLVRQLHGSRGVGFLDGASPFTGGGRDGYDMFEFEDDRGRRIVMAFADGARSVRVRVPARAGHATLVDRHNRRRRIEAVGSSYELTLPGATSAAGWPSSDNAKGKALGSPEHLVGGATLLVIEE